jgi:hypothetical protein
MTTDTSNVYTTSGMFDYSFSLGYKASSIEKAEEVTENNKKVEEIAKPSDRLDFKIV